MNRLFIALAASMLLVSTVVGINAATYSQNHALCINSTITSGPGSAITAKDCGGTPALISPTTGNVVGDIVVMSTTTNGVTDSGYTTADLLATRTRVYAKASLGMKGDGSTDDSTTLQTWIDSWSVANLPPIIFEPGTYILHDIRLPHGRFYIECLSRADTILKLKNSANSYLFADTSYTTNSATVDRAGYITGCTIDGNKTNNTTTVPMIVGAREFHIRQNFVQNAAADAIGFYATSANGTTCVTAAGNSEVRNNKISNNNGRAVAGLDFSCGVIADTDVGENTINNNGLSCDASGLNYQVYSDRAAGWQVHDNNFFSSIACGDLKLLKFAHNMIVNNAFDGGANTANGANPIYETVFDTGGTNDWAGLQVSGNNFKNAASSLPGSATTFYAVHVISSGSGGTFTSALCACGNVFWSPTISYTTILYDGSHVTDMPLDARGNTYDLHATAPNNVNIWTGEDWLQLRHTPTTLAGYHISDAQPLNANLTSLSGLSASTGIMKRTGAGAFGLAVAGTDYAEVGANASITALTSLANGSCSSPSERYNTNYGTFYDSTNTGMGFCAGGVEVAWISATGYKQLVTGGGSSIIEADGEGTTKLVAFRASGDANGAVIECNKARGTQASPAVPVTNDTICGENFRIWIASTQVTAASILAKLTETSTVDPTHFGTELQFKTTPIGSSSLTTAMVIKASGGVVVTGGIDEGAGTLSAPTLYEGAVSLAAKYQAICTPAAPVCEGTLTGLDVPLGSLAEEYVIGRGNTQLVDPINSSENILATVTLPANVMKANGCLTITSIWSYTNSANIKSLKIRFSGGGGSGVLSLAPTTTASVTAYSKICNRNSVSSQIFSNSTGGTVAATAAVSTGSVNTALSTTLVFTAQLTAAGVTASEAINLEHYDVVDSPMN